MIKISIILTSYNHEKYIHEAIESVIQQTYPNWELIIWDDASTDASWEVISKYKDLRIKAFKNDTNIGPTYGVNKAIFEIAQGQYIAIHHSDDIWEPNKLEEQAAYLDAHAHIGAVFSDALAISEDGLPLTDEKHFYQKIFSQPNRTRHEWLNHFFFKGNALCHPSVLIRKSCYERCGEYKPYLAQLPDLDMWIRLCLNYEIHISPKKLIKFRVRDNEANSSGNRSDSRIRGAYEYYKILSNYKLISSAADFKKIFNINSEEEIFSQIDIDFKIAIFAIETQHQAGIKLFGLDTLYNLLLDKISENWLKHRHDFTTLSFIKLTGCKDVLSNEALLVTAAEHSQFVSKLRYEQEKEIEKIKNVQEKEIEQIKNGIESARAVEVAKAKSELLALQQIINSLKGSRSWRLTVPLRFFGDVFRISKKYIENKLRYKKIIIQKNYISINKFDDINSWGILTTKHTLFVAHIIANRLREHGFKVQVLTANPEFFTLNRYIVICPQMFSVLPPLEKSILYQMEQSVSSRWFTSEYLNCLQKAAAVLDYSLINIEFLKTKNIAYPNVYYMPIGGCENFYHNKNAKSIKYDILFYGDSNSSSRRREMLSALIASGYKVKIANEIFSSDMHDLIQSARLVINIHYYENALLETTRIQECLSLGVPVISESARDQCDYPELSGAVRFFEQGSIPDMLYAVKMSLDNEVSKQQIVESVSLSESRFKFMFDRFLLGMGYIEDSKIKESIPKLTINTQLVALSLPETIERRKVFVNSKPKDCLIFDGIRKSTGWIGCGLSYSLLANQALQCGLSQLTVMEDDVLLPGDFDKKLSVINRYLKSQKNNWDIFSGLIAALHPELKVLKVEVFEGVKFATINKMTSMVFNIYNKKALNVISNWDSKNPNTENTIDRYLEAHLNLRIIVALPYLVGHREELNSTLWGFNNKQYKDMIKESEFYLSDLVRAYELENGTI